MKDEEEYTPCESHAPDTFGYKMTITIDDGFEHMRVAVIGLRAAVIATGISNPMTMLNPGIKEAAQKEAHAMRHGIYQPHEGQTMAEMQKDISDKMIEAGRPLNWLKRFYREKIIGHKLNISFIFDEIVNKFKVQVKYRPNGGEVSVIANGRHKGREKTIAEMICHSLDEEGVPYDIKFEESLL